MSCKHEALLKQFGLGMMTEEYFANKKPNYEVPEYDPKKHKILTSGLYERVSRPELKKKLSAMGWTIDKICSVTGLKPYGVRNILEPMKLYAPRPQKILLFCRALNWEIHPHEIAPELFDENITYTDNDLHPLSIYCADNGMIMEDIGRAIGLSRGTVSGYITFKTPMPDDVIARVVEKFPAVSADKLREASAFARGWNAKARKGRPRSW